MLRDFAAGVYQTGDTVSHISIFYTALWFNSLPYLSPPFLCQITAYTDSVWLGGGGVLRVLGTIFCRSLTLCI
jgi:hypothetical protein